ncbi:NAD-dependent epimerase/dehydratase family protein [Pseudarthrobacter sp. DSP2-3-2b1]|uniref:NAD-dependent epimerase/dehydratase family protein n=1 Tax=Pseudarthrobacter sp. DSP2-3-2b1 TaxID=2804661 RepID=UPI003CF56E5A
MSTIGVSTVLLTGSSGRMGGPLSKDLAAQGYAVRLLDLVPHPDPPAGATQYVGPLDESGPLRAALLGGDAVVHLAAIPNEDTWEATVAETIASTEFLLRECAAAGVRKVLLASSHHVAGFYDKTAVLPGDAQPRPDSYYGVAKATIEALGALYHHRFGMDVLALRIGSCFPRPTAPRSLAIWLSPRDMTGLVLAWLNSPGTTFRTAWGVSANTRGVLSTIPLEEMGYKPVDDSELFLPELLERYGADSIAEADTDWLGGPFCTNPLGRTLNSQSGES